MKKFFSRILLSTLTLLFLFTPFLLQAIEPSVVSVKLNGQDGNVVFNVANGKEQPLSIELTANQLVKFNTIAICSTSVTCSRTTASRYFTQTDPSVSILKSWDGLTGGSSPTIVSEGEYKILVTMAIPGSASSPSQELDQRITVTSSGVSGGNIINSAENTNNSNNESLSDGGG